MSKLPLEESLLHWTVGTHAPHLDYKLTRGISELMENLEVDSSLDLKTALKLSSEVRLDPSQAACFKAGLRHKVALIQGPPGIFNRQVFPLPLLIGHRDREIVHRLAHS